MFWSIKDPPLVVYLGLLRSRSCAVGLYTLEVHSQTLPSMSCKPTAIQYCIKICVNRKTAPNVCYMFTEINEHCNWNVAYIFYLCKNCSVYIQCKGDIVVIDIKQHKSQFKNSNFTITQSTKFF